MRKKLLSPLIILILSVFTAFSSAASEKTEITWLGQSGFRIITPTGRVLFIDPWFTNSAYPKGKEQLESHMRADLIFVTHGHGDHVGNSAELARKTGAKLVATQELGRAMIKYANFPEKQFSQETAGNIGGDITLLDGEIRVAFVPAVHSSSIETDRVSQNVKNIAYAGQAIGFVINIKNGPTIYHTGDTDLFSDMALVRDYGEIDIMMVCTGDKFSMGARRAARAVALVDPLMAIPMHYVPIPAWTSASDTFSLETRKLLKKDISKALAPGETFTWEQPTATQRK
ncbi:MAG: metal-dependent hydrolase [Geobacteraceae bacterium]|nr:metal-dependent hydrolase [Geobacteraceae bacterium]